MTERMNLNMEDIEMVTGGSWCPETLTDEEFTEYLKLKNAWQDSFKYGSDSPQYVEAFANINAFYDRMNEKYGVDPSPLDI